LLDQLTQQNAALVEQNAVPAHALKDQADQLAHAVVVFKLSGTATNSCPGNFLCHINHKTVGSLVLPRNGTGAKYGASVSINSRERKIKTHVYNGFANRQVMWLGAM
jgi:hypothetical protein